MDYKNDNRTPRDRITGEFLSELLFTDLGGDCDCKYATRLSGDCSCDRNNRNRENSGSNRSARSARTSASVCPETYTNKSMGRKYREGSSGGGNVEITGNYSLAMSYIPMQEFGDLFDIETGFCEGTIFKNLRFPFYPTPCRREND